MSPTKPKFGEACNGCGLCCQFELCAHAIKALGNIPAPCPALLWRNGRSSCLLVETADTMGPAESAFIRLTLGVGAGCDASDDAEAQWAK
jgi:hypothetical protein